VSMHATYLSMYVCFSIAAALYLLFFEKRYYNLLALLLLPVFMASLLLLSSRIVFIPFLVILVFVTPFFIRRMALVAYCVCLLLFVGASAYYLGKSSAFEYRLKTDTLRELNIKKQSHFMNLDSVNTNDATRAERWKCALELIRERPLTGYGTGDEKW